MRKKHGACAHIKCKEKNVAKYLEWFLCKKHKEKIEDSIKEFD